MNAIGTQVRNPINSGLTRWRIAVLNKYLFITKVKNLSVLCMTIRVCGCLHPDLVVSTPTPELSRILEGSLSFNIVFMSLTFKVVLRKNGIAVCCVDKVDLLLQPNTLIAAIFLHYT